jgi:Superfamily I DNA and RNA helicases
MLASADDLAFTRIINTPRRGIGNKTIDIIRGEALRNNLTMYEVIKTKRDFGGKVQKTLDDFVVMVEKLTSEKEQHSIDKLLELLLDQSGYRKMWEDNNETDRLENIKELINDVQQFMATYPEGNLDEYLQLVSLYGDHEEYKTGSHVQLMTIHAAKGLEFDNVFVVGMSDGVFPSERSMQEGRKGLEEERRLAYVAYTRARKRLFLSETTGFSYVLNKVRTRSRFIDEIAPVGRRKKTGLCCLYQS